jgi:Fe-S cluster assembly ATP-binding protein
MTGFIFLLIGYNKNVREIIIVITDIGIIDAGRMNIMATLEVKDLHVAVKDEESKKEKEILKGVNLSMKTGEIHAIMGPNGTGKSTLSQTIMGQPGYRVTQGDILLNGESIVDMPVDERARKGLFLAMQYPAEIQGVTNAEFLRAAINARRADDDQISVMDFIKKLDKNLKLLDMSQSMTERYLNEGFSGGEKKRNEILQLLMIEPSFAILDEIDSGLDIDALKVVSKGVNSMRGDNFGSLIITHYQRLLNYIIPDTVHVMMDGRIVKTGGPDLAKKLEDEGYAGLRDELGLDIKLVDDED